MKQLLKCVSTANFSFIDTFLRNQMKENMIIFFSFSKHLNIDRIHTYRN